jgi:hypothetical protein
MASSRHPVDDPLQDFMNDVVRTARRALKDGKRREKEKEQRDRLEARMEARMSDEARQKRDRAKKRARDAMGATKMSRSEGSRESSSSAPQSREGSSRPEHAHTYGGPLPDWKADVARLKSSLAAFDVSANGLTVTWHAPSTEPTFDPKRDEFPTLVTSKSVSVLPSKRSGVGVSPIKSAKGGGSGDLPSLTKESEIHHKFEKSPLFTDGKALAMMQAKKLKNRSTAREDSGGKAGFTGKGGAFVGGGGMVSATDGLKQAILSGKIVKQDGTLVQDIAAELQGPTSWSGQDIGVKYRGEVEREAAWRAYVQASKAAAQIHDASSVYFATPTVARHQLYVMLDRIVANENERSLIRARQRGNMRRFVLDIHQIWLTNLEHVREHRLLDDAEMGGDALSAGAGVGPNPQTASNPNAVLSLRIDDDDDSGGGRGEGEGEGGFAMDASSRGGASSAEMSLMSTRLLNMVPPDRGLERRRDKEAIVNMSSQIQSVAPERTWQTVPRPGSMGEIADDDAMYAVRATRRPTANRPELPAVPPVMTRLMSREPRVVVGEFDAPGDRRLHVFIDRLAPSLLRLEKTEAGGGDAGQDAAADAAAARTAPQGEEEEALWRVTAYDDADGSQGRFVVTEATARRVVEDARRVDAVEAKERMQKSASLVMAGGAAAERAAAAAAEYADVRTGTSHRQAVRLEIGGDVENAGRKRGFMLEVSLLQPCGNWNPIMVTLKLLPLRKRNHVVQHCLGTFSATEVKARLGLLDAPVAVEGLRFWEALGDEHWRRLASHLAANLPAEEVAERDRRFRKVALQRKRQRQGIKVKPGADKDPPFRDRLDLALGGSDQPLNDQKGERPFDAAILDSAVLLLPHLRWSPHADDYDEQEELLDWAAVAEKPMHRCPQGRGFRLSLNGVVDDRLSKELGGEGDLRGEYADGRGWEDDLEWDESVVPLTMHATGYMESGEMDMVPGAAVSTASFNRPGLWFSYKPFGGGEVPEMSRAVARQFRLGDAAPEGSSKSNTVLVNMLMALDTPLLTPNLCAWVHACITAPAPLAEPPWGWIPFACQDPKIVRACQVESPVDTRTSQPLVLLTAAEVPLDFERDPGWDKKTERTGPRAVGHRRRWFWRHETGFRLTQVAELLCPNAFVASRFFGLTMRGALPNTPLVGSGHRWCSQEGCKKSLTRPRDASDYSFVSKSKIHHGANDPGIFSLHLRGMADQLKMDEVVAFCEEAKLNINLRDGQTSVDELRTMTLDGARARGWPEGDAGRLLQKVAEIRDRTAMETTWHIELYKIALGGLAAFVEWQRVISNMRRAEAEEERRQQRLEASRRLLEAKMAMEREQAEKEVRSAMFDEELSPHAKMRLAKEQERARIAAAEAEGAADEAAKAERAAAEAARIAAEDIPVDEVALMRELAQDKRLLRMLADQLGLPPEIVDELELAGEEAKLAAKRAEEEAAGKGMALAAHENIRDPGAIRHGAMPLLTELLDADRAYEEPDVPRLDLKPAVVVKGAGWRRLQREAVTGFYQRANMTHTQGAVDSVYNTMPELRVVGLVDPEADVDVSSVVLIITRCR